MSKKKSVEARYDHDLPCQFKGAADGKQKLRLGVAIGDMEAALARELFRGTQLRVRLEVDPNSDGDVAGQTKMPGSTIEHEAVVAVAGWRDGHEVTTSLQFESGPTELQQLGRFSWHSGRLQVSKMASAEGGE